MHVAPTNLFYGVRAVQSVGPGTPAFALRILVATALLAAPLAGCIGKDRGGGNGGDPGTFVPPADNRTEDNATLPTGEESLGLQETNKTEEGVGGVDHKHDYWKGETQVTLVDDEFAMQPFPIYPEGEGSSARAAALVKLPPPALVYEGADRVDVVLLDPVVKPTETVIGDDFGLPGAPNPAPPTFTIQARSARDSEWRAESPIALATAFSVPVNELETDMPHSVQSLWVFRVFTDRTDVSSVRVQVVAYKGREVVDWPGHPDFYADVKHRVVLDEDVTTHRAGVTEFLLYGAGTSWVAPTKLVSHGTTRLVVFANITSVAASNGAPATGAFLEYHNATLLDEEDQFTDRLDDSRGEDNLKDYRFDIEVTPDAMDGPYQPESRWGFRMVAVFGNAAVPGVIGVGLCPGCFPYDISYHITVIAVSGEAEAGEAVTA